MHVTNTPDEPMARVLEPAPALDRPAVVGRALQNLGVWLAAPAHLFAALLALVPLVFVLLFIAQRGSNTPVWDHWANTVPIALKAASGTLSPADILRQNFDHRLVFHNLITAFLTWTTHWDIRVELALEVALVGVSLVLLVALFRRDAPRSVALFLVPVSALLFAVRHNALWLWSIMIGVPLTVTFLLAALAVLWRSRVGWKPLLLAGFFAACMTLSQLHGLAGWPLLLAALWLRGYRKPAYFAGWLAIMLVVVGLYFTNYDFSLIGANEQGNSAGLVRDPAKIALYMIAYLGNPFVPSSGSLAGLASVIGVLGVSVFAANFVYLWRRERGLISLGPWLVLAGFAVGSAFLTALGRSHVYPEPYPVQPLLDRYVMPPTLLWIAVLALGIRTVSAMESLRGPSIAQALGRLNVLLFVPLIGLYLFANASVIDDGPMVSERQAQCFINYPRTRNAGCFAQLYLKQTPLADVLVYTDQMAIHQLAAFATIPPAFTQISELHRAERQNIGEQVNTGWQTLDLGQGYEPVVLLQHAPATVAFEVAVPETPLDVLLITAAYVDPSNLADTSVEQDGVLFRVGVRLPDGTTRLLTETVYDPRVDERYKPIRVDLGPYQGQTVQIILQTQNRETPHYDWSMWIDPIVVARSNPQS